MDANLILGSALGIVAGVVVTLLGAKLLEKRVDLRYTVTRSLDLVPKDTTIPLTISYEGGTLKHLVQLESVWINRGSVPLQDVPIKWKVNTSGFIAGVNVPDHPDKIANSDPDVTVGTHVDRLTFAITLLNPGERSTLAFLVADDPTAELIVSARTVGVVARPDAPSRFYSAEWPIVAGVVVNIAFLATASIAVLPLWSFNNSDIGARDQLVALSSLTVPLGLLSLMLLLFVVTRYQPRATKNDE
jgi:hypothetical protein